MEPACLREDDVDIDAGGKGGVTFPTNGGATRDAAGAGTGGVGDNSGPGDVTVGDDATHTTTMLVAASDSAEL